MFSCGLCCLPAASLAVAFVMLKYHSCLCTTLATLATLATLPYPTPNLPYPAAAARTHKLAKTCPNELITLANARVDDVAPLLLDSNNNNNNNYAG